LNDEGPDICNAEKINTRGASSQNSKWATPRPLCLESLDRLSSLLRPFSDKKLRSNFRGFVPVRVVCIIFIPRNRKTHNRRDPSSWAPAVEESRFDIVWESVIFLEEEATFRAGAIGSIVNPQEIRARERKVAEKEFTNREDKIHDMDRGRRR
jgi:hypothetical protein